MFARLVAFEVSLAILAMGLSVVFGISLFDQLRPTVPNVVFGLLATVPMLMVMLGVSYAPWKATHDLMDRVRELIVVVCAGCGVAELGLVALVAGIGEELFFRGLLQSGLTGLVGMAPAIALTSVVFALGHAVTRFYAVLAFAVSLYLGWIAVASASLVPPIVAHAMYDWIALIYLMRGVQDGPKVGSASAGESG